MAQKIRRAKTDPEPLPSEPAGLAGPTGSGKPGRHLRRPQTTRRSRRCSAEHSAARNSRRSRAALTELIVAKLAPIRAEMIRLAERDRIMSTLCSCKGRSARARAIAHAGDGLEVKDVLGLVR